LIVVVDLQDRFSQNAINEGKTITGLICLTKKGVNVAHGLHRELRMTDREELETSTIKKNERLDAIAVPWILSVLIRGRRTISLVVAVGFFLALAAALLRSTYYTSSFSFVPQTNQDQSRSGLASLAGQIGINIGSLTGQAQSPQLYADLLQTREILIGVARDTIVDENGKSVPLTQFLGEKGSSAPVVWERTMRDLRNKIINSSVATRTTGMVTVTVRTRSPRASFAIARQLLDGLNRYNIQTRKSQAGEERRFIEQRLTITRGELRAAEDALQQFLQVNRQYGSPDLTFKKQRLESEVTLQQQVVNGLAQQYEDARIREVRDTPVISVLESPTIPVLPDPGGRALTVVLGTLAALAVGVAYILVRAGWARQRAEDTGEDSYDTLATDWRKLRTRFKS
jgi:uncharacterized protein involved in exopolysaccharide biosynthesis